MDGHPSDLPGSPFRSPAWRWLCARSLFDAGRRIRPSRDDAWIARARRFLAAQAAREKTPVPKRAPRPDPVVAAAYEIAHAPGSQRARETLEALLLTGEPLAEIARRCALSVETVDAFAALFFDVVSHLGARDWIMLRAIQCGPYNHFAADGLPGLWRYFAYVGGVRVLEIVMAVTLDQPFPAWFREGSQGDRDAETRLRFKLKLALALMTATSDEQVEAIIALHRQEQAARRPVAARRRGPTTKVDLMARLLSKGTRSRHRRLEELLAPIPNQREDEVKASPFARRTKSITTSR